MGDDDRARPAAASSAASASPYAPSSQPSSHPSSQPSPPAPPPAAAHVCPNCGKAFAREDLLRRHLLREQRAAANPRRPKPKSCQECSRTKTRCDQDRPKCFRCRKKNKTCIYENDEYFSQIGFWAEAGPSQGPSPFDPFDPPIEHISGAAEAAFSAARAVNVDGGRGRYAFTYGIGSDPSYFPSTTNAAALRPRPVAPPSSNVEPSGELLLTDLFPPARVSSSLLPSSPTSQPAFPQPSTPATNVSLIHAHQYLPSTVEPTFASNENSSKEWTQAPQFYPYQDLSESLYQPPRQDHARVMEPAILPSSSLDGNSAQLIRPMEGGQQLSISPLYPDDPMMHQFRNF